MANLKKFKKSVALAVNVEEETRDKLTKLAEERNISRSDLVNEIITNTLNK